MNSTDAHEIDWTEDGKYDVTHIRMFDGSTETRRHVTCPCGCRRDIDIASSCEVCWRGRPS
jgi:hypothetical protein